MCVKFIIYILLINLFEPIIFYFLHLNWGKKYSAEKPTFEHVSNTTIDLGVGKLPWIFVNKV